MKTTNFAVKVAAIMLIFVGTAFNSMAQRNGRGQATNNANTCINSLPNMTTEQQKQVAELNQNFQNEMNVFRAERRTTADEKTKLNARLKMLEHRDAHRTEVRNVLTEEQKLAYNAIPKAGNQQQGAKMNRGNNNKRQGAMNSGRGNRNLNRGNGTCIRN